jgi:hypothetical protein
MRNRITARENIANMSGRQEIEVIQMADRTIGIGVADPEAAVLAKTSIASTTSSSTISASS